MKVFCFRVFQILGNIEDIKDYHKQVILPKMEKAVGNSDLMRCVEPNRIPQFTLFDKGVCFKMNNQDCQRSMEGTV